MTTQPSVQFAYIKGDKVRHIESDQVAEIIRQKVKTTAPGKMEAMYAIRLEDGSELNATQKELVVILGGLKKLKPKT